MNQSQGTKVLLMFTSVLCLFMFSYILQRPTENRNPPTPSDQLTLELDKKKLVPRRDQKQPVTDKKDLNCIYSLPKRLVDQAGEMPIVIPDSLSLPLQVLSCIYHRYVTTVQTPCVEPKAFGISDKKAGYICVDNDLLPVGDCNVIILGKVVDKNYIRQLKQQYKCDILGNQNKRSRDIYDAIKSSMQSQEDAANWMTSQQNTKINLLVFTLKNNGDVESFIDVLLDSNIISKIMQISLKIYYDPRKSTTQGYEKRLRLLKELFNIGFRIFFFTRELECRFASISKTKFVSCYSVNFIRRQTPPSLISIPSDTELRNMTKLELARLYDRYTSSLQTMCQQNTRMGFIKDGGWNICHDPEYRPVQPCLVYSFGIHNDFTFDDEISRVYGCQVFSFDPSMRKGDHKHSNKVWFKNMGISGKNYQKGKWKLRTVDFIRDMLRHTDKVIDVFKMDVEASEWPALIQMLESDTLTHIGQLMVEFHSHGEYYWSHLSILRKLFDFGLRIFWTHKNNNCKFPLDGGFSSKCIEVYFINIKFYERKSGD